MHAPVLTSWLLVALCAASGGYCVARSRAEAGVRRAAAGAEALMSFGMAAMAVPAAVLALSRWVCLVYAAVFGAVALAACCAIAVDRGRKGHHAHHLIGTLAMVYMAWAMAGGVGHAGGGAADGMAGMEGMSATPAGSPLLTGVLLVYFAGHALWAGARLIPSPAAAGAGPAVAGGEAAVAGPRGRPEVTLACRLSMSMAMLAMLLAL